MAFRPILLSFQSCYLVRHFSSPVFSITITIRHVSCKRTEITRCNIRIKHITHKHKTEASIPDVWRRLFKFLQILCACSQCLTVMESKHQQAIWHDDHLWGNFFYGWRTSHDGGDQEGTDWGEAVCVCVEGSGNAWQTAVGSRCRQKFPGG